MNDFHSFEPYFNRDGNLVINGMVISIEDALALFWFLQENERYMNSTMQAKRDPRHFVYPKQVKQIIA